MSELNDSNDSISSSNFEPTKVLYTGAFMDCSPLRDESFDNIKKFIYVDGAPNSEYWGEKAKGCFGYYENLNFEECFKLNLELADQVILSFDKTEENMWHIQLKGGREVFYFYNTEIPNGMTPKMRDMIEDCEHIIYTGDEMYDFANKNLPYLHTIYIGKHIVVDDLPLDPRMYRFIEYDSEWKEMEENGLKFSAFDKATGALLLTSKYTRRMSTNTTKSLLYIGSFLDCSTFRDVAFDNITRFVYVDGAPNSEYWGERAKGCLGYYENLNFEECLKLELEVHNQVILSFDKTETNVFHIKLEGGRELYYFYNTIFPTGLTQKMRDIVNECEYIMHTGTPIDDEMLIFIAEELPNIHSYYVGYGDRDHLANLKYVIIKYDSMFKETEYEGHIDFPAFNIETGALLLTSNYTRQQVAQTVN